jgi:hypothetical protein
MIDMKRIEVQQVPPAKSGSPNFVTVGGGSPDQSIFAGNVTNWLKTNPNPHLLSGKTLAQVKATLANPTVPHQTYDATPEGEMGVGRTLYVVTEKNGNKKAYLEESTTDAEGTQRWMDFPVDKLPAAFPRQVLESDIPAHAPGGKVALPPFFPREGAMRAVYRSDIKNAVTNGTATSSQQPPAAWGTTKGSFHVPPFSVEGKNGSHIEVPYNMTGKVINGELWAADSDTQPTTYFDCGRAPLFLA